MAGQVVRAIRGERGNYRPIQSALCSSCQPLPVANMLLDYTAADTLYIADLDALTGGSVQASQLSALLEALPGTSIWLDAGFRTAADFAVLADRLGPAARRLTPVFASEALATPEAARQCLADPAKAILSLDRRHQQILDAAGCWSNPAWWPERLIVMTLERVGSGEGPDLETLAAIRSQAPKATLVGAGGIRNEADLQAAAAAGADAWLVASALHDRHLARRSR